MLSTSLRRIPHVASTATRATQTDAAASSSSSLSSVNAAEVAHFSRLAAQWWDERGEFALLHRMNPVRAQFVRDQLTAAVREEKRGEDAARAMVQRRDVLRGMDVVDVGCGGGLLAESLARMGARTLGIDASEANIRIASVHARGDPQLAALPSASGGSLSYMCTSAEELLRGPRRFDAVCAMEVVEHVDNPTAFLTACAELVKPGGHLFLSTIARTPLAFLLAIVAAEHVLRYVSPGTHTYAKFIQPSELVSFFQNYPPSSVAGGGARPWITRTYAGGLPTRTEAEVRGLLYKPWSGDWVLMPRSATPWGAAQCNYIFWVRKPLET